MPSDGTIVQRFFEFFEKLGHEIGTAVALIIAIVVAVFALYLYQKISQLDWGTGGDHGGR